MIKLVMVAIKSTRGGMWLNYVKHATQNGLNDPQILLYHRHTRIVTLNDDDDDDDICFTFPHELILS